MHTLFGAVALLCSQPTPEVAETVDTHQSSSRIGLNLGVTVTSIFNDRGSNLLSLRGQNEHQLALVPTINYTIADTDLYVGYMGVFKVAGRDPDVGTNAFQLLGAGIKKRVLDDQVEIDGALRFVMLPLADEPEMPTVFEPALTLSWLGPVTMSLGGFYAHAIPSQFASRRYFYAQAGLARGFQLTESTSLKTSSTAGYKVFEDPGAADRLLDVATQLALDVEVESVVLSPAVNLAWVDIAEESIENEYMAWGSLGLNLGL